MSLPFEWPSCAIINKTSGQLHQFRLNAYNYERLIKMAVIASAAKQYQMFTKEIAAVAFDFFAMTRGFC